MRKLSDEELETLVMISAIIGATVIFCTVFVCIVVMEKA